MRAFQTSRRAWLAAGLGAGMLAACGGGGSSGSSYMGGGNPGTGGMGPPTPGKSYAMTSLVSDVGANGPYSSTHTDANLVNGWGVAFNPQGFVWVADAGTSKSTLYDGQGVPQSLVVSIPPGAAGSASPTGIVFNGSTDFAVTQAGKTGAGVFLFVGEGGTVSGWSPGVNMTSAVTVFDGAAAGKVYMGAALASSNGANFLYATDFHNATVDVFDGQFNKVAVAGGFADSALPPGYAPFGIQAIGSSIYVTFARQDASGRRQMTGAGLGVVDVFDATGHLTNRLIGPGGPLNAPWGVAMAPADFGAFSNDLLVANLGDGHVNAFNPSTGALVGTLSKSDGTPIAIDGLWGIAFGNGLDGQSTNALFFAAGPAGYSHGVYGRIDTQ